MPVLLVLTSVFPAIKRLAVKDKHPSNAQNDIWAIASTAHEALNQSVGRNLTSIYATYFDQQREANAELMSKMNPLYTLGKESFSVFDHVKATAGLDAQAVGNLKHLATGGESISKMVQGFIDMRSSPVMDNHAVKVLEQFNRPFMNDLVNTAQNALPENWASPFTRVMAEAASAQVKGISNISAAARGYSFLPDYGVAPLMAQVSTALKANTIAREFSETITASFQIPESAIDRLGRKLDFYQVDDLSMAMKVAIADPEIEETVKDLFDEHPEPVEDLSFKLSLDGTGPWLSAFSTYFTGAISGAHGAVLATIVIVALLGIVYSEWERSSKTKESRETK